MSTAPQSSLLLPDLARLRARASPRGDLQRQGALLRHIVATKNTGFEHLRPFHAMLWPSAQDNWTLWLREQGQLPGITNRISLMMDSWISSSIALRLALHTAWAADAGALSRKSLRMAMNTTVHACEQYIWPMFRGRAVDTAPPGRSLELSNQLSGMLAGMLFTGHVFGHRLCRNRLARDMFQRVRDSFPLLVGALDCEGYQGEGPIYQLDVEAPALILCAELLDDLEGGDHYHQKYAHPCDKSLSTSLARFVEASATYLYSPSGLCLPLDDYGANRANAAFPLVYAAQRSGQRKFLDMLAQRGPFGPGQFLWHTDDLAWRIIYWPQKVHGKPWKQPGSFVLPRHFGIIDNCADSRLLQLWDRCEPLPATHAHINPNSITFEVFNVPVLIEGACRAARAPFSAEPPGLRSVPCHLDPFGDVFRFAPGDYRNAGALCIGAHNCVLVDKQDVIHPQTDAAGKLIRFAEGPVSSLLASDCTSIYEKAELDLIASTRVSIADKRLGFFVVADDIASRTGHTFTWQAHVRGQCKHTSLSVLVETREGIGMEIAAADGAPFESRHMPSYPNTFEGESIRLRRHARGRCVRFIHLLRPIRLRREIMDLTNGWHSTLGEPLGALQDSPELKVTDRWRASLATPAFIKKPETLGRWVTYRKTITIPALLRGARIFLHLPLPAGRTQQTDVFALWVNDIPFDMAPAAEAPLQMLDSVTDITRAVRFGSSNCLCFKLISSGDGGTRGKAFLFAQLPGTSLRPARLFKGKRGLRIRIEGGVCRINPFGPPCTGTDAACGLRGYTDQHAASAHRAKALRPRANSYGALFECTRARIDGLTLSSDLQISVQWDARTLWLLLPKSGCHVTAGGKALVAGQKRRLSRLGERMVEVIWK